MNETIIDKTITSYINRAIPIGESFLDPKNLEISNLMTIAKMIQTEEHKQLSNPPQLCEDCRNEQNSDACNLNCPNELCANHIQEY